MSEETPTSTPIEAPSAGDASPASWVPRLLSFYQDAVLDGEEVVAGYRNVAWGLRWFDGSVITLEGVSADRPPAIRVWSGLEEAIVGLDALVCGFAPQRAIRESRGSGAERE
jgi:hypothetical protein